MIINFYLPENDQKLIDVLKNVSDQKRRSFSFVVREALEYYLVNVLRIKEQDIHNTKKEEQ
ncbi:hypothetical protein KAR34_01715 [bacterium]|nr:hypothetical protein [bacterium]